MPHSRGRPLSFPSLAHERVVSVVGRRSGLPITVAVHSTALGAALGGCRLWSYDAWEDGLADALRLSSAMTLKCAVAGLPTGGGKSVINVPSGGLAGERRTAALRDLGEVVESLGGSYRTAEDVGTTSADMLVVRELTDHVVGLPVDNGGVGEPAAPTAIGVYSAVRSTAARIGEADLAGLRITVSGLGQVGSRLARRLAESGAVLTLSDLDPDRRSLARELGAVWADVGDALTRPADIVVPAGVGGVLTRSAIASLDCRAVVGPANNQLADPDGDEALAARGIVWAPDFVVNSGGAIATILLEVEGVDSAEVDRRLHGIGATLDAIFDLATAHSITPLRAAVRLAEARLNGGADSARIPIVTPTSIRRTRSPDAHAASSRPSPR